MNLLREQHLLRLVFLSSGGDLGGMHDQGTHFPAAFQNLQVSLEMFQLPAVPWNHLLLTSESLFSTSQQRKERSVTSKSATWFWHRHILNTANPREDRTIWHTEHRSVQTNRRQWLVGGTRANLALQRRMMEEGPEIMAAQCDCPVTPQKRSAGRTLAKMKTEETKSSTWEHNLLVVSESRERQRERCVIGGEAAKVM